MSWYKVRHPFSCCEGIVRKPFAGTLWMNQATCSCPKQKDYENPTQDSYIKIIKMERQLTSGLSESLVATNDISFTPSINSWHFLQPRPPFRRCTTGVYPNFPSPLGGAMRRASSTYRGSKKFNGNSGSSWEAPWYHESSTVCMHCAVERFWTVEKWWKMAAFKNSLKFFNAYMASFHIFPVTRNHPPSSPPCQRGRGRTVADWKAADLWSADFDAPSAPWDAGRSRGKPGGRPWDGPNVGVSWWVREMCCSQVFCTHPCPLRTFTLHAASDLFQGFHLKAILKWITIKVANCHAAATDSYWAEQCPEFSELGGMSFTLSVSIQFLPTSCFFSWIFQHPPVKRLSWAKTGQHCTPAESRLMTH